nr:MAG TPA: hypothetical protein [Caudoviricetes sp.]
MAKGDNIRRYNNVRSGVSAENRAIKNRPGGWSAGEARRTHRRANARAVRALRASAY